MSEEIIGILDDNEEDLDLNFGTEVAISVELPDPAGHDGEFLRTDGERVEWASAEATWEDVLPSGGIPKTDLSDELQDEINNKASSSGIESAISDHNSSDSAHSDIRTELSGKASTSDINSAVSAHNSSDSAHSDIRTALSGKGTYSKPSGGIPKTDLASAVQTSLGKADNALQSIPAGSITKHGSVLLPTTIGSGNWVKNGDLFYCTKTVAGVTADNDIKVCPAPSSYLKYCECQIFATEQATSAITFACVTVPDESLLVQIEINKIAAEA